MIILIEQHFREVKIISILWYAFVILFPQVRQLHIITMIVSQLEKVQMLCTLRSNVVLGMDSKYAIRIYKLTTLLSISDVRFVTNSIKYIITTPHWMAWILNWFRNMYHWYVISTNLNHIMGIKMIYFTMT